MQLLGEHLLFLYLIVYPAFNITFLYQEFNPRIKNLYKVEIKKRSFYLCICTSAYDRAAIKFRGVEADINFNIEDYEEDLKQVGRGRDSVESYLSYLEQ